MPWNQNELINIFKKLLICIERLRALGVCHRDLKPHNILYSLKHKSYKISDFSEGKIIH